MKAQVLIFFSLITIIHFNRPPEAELISVIEINRHGARTSKSIQPKTLTKLFGKEMTLTPHGYRQQELLGRYIKEKYIKEKHFLNECYSQSQFRIYSTPIQRTINSAIGYISGLYPHISTKLMYQNQTIGLISDDTIPITQKNKLGNVSEDTAPKITLPIEIFSKANDIFHRGNCIYKGKQLKKIITSTTEEIFNLSSVNLTECAIQLSNFTQIEMPPDELNKTNYEQYLSSIQSYLQSYLYHHGKSLEDSSLSQEVIEYIKKNYINKKYGYRITDSKYNRMLTSELFKDILQRFSESIIDSSQRGLNVYSAHDTTLMNIFMNILKNDKIREYARLAVDDKDHYDFLFPPFASVLLFELFKLNGQYYVTIEYNGNVIQSDFKYLNNDSIHNGRIKYDDFVMLLENLIEDDYEKLVCGGHSIRKDSNTNDDYDDDDDDYDDWIESVENNNNDGETEEEDFYIEYDDKIASEKLNIPMEYYRV